MSNETLKFKIRLFQSSRKNYDNNGKEQSIHFRMNNKTNEFEIIVNRSCIKCLNFKKTKGGTEICTKCTYLKNWLELGKR